MSRWKHVVLASLITFASGSLSATGLTEFLFCGRDISPCPTAPYRPFTGFFVGVNGGIATNMAETSIFSNVLTLEAPGISETYLAENNIYQLRPLGEVYGGWGWQFCWLYLGARIGVNFSKFDPRANFEAEIIDLNLATPTLDLQENTLKTELRLAEYTFDFKPGIVFCDNTMFFGIFGAALNKQHMHGRGSYSRTELSAPPVLTGASELEVSRTRSAAGFRGGVGIEHMFCGCLSINLMYVYTRYWKFMETVADSMSTVTQGSNAIFSTKAHKQVTSIGLTCYF